MTTDDIAKHIHNVLPEFTEAYALVAISASTGEPIVRYWCPDQAACDQINAMIAGVALSGGVKVEEVIEV